MTLWCWRCDVDVAMLTLPLNNHKTVRTLPGIFWLPDSMNKPTLNEPAINLLHWKSNVTILDVVILLHLGIYLVIWINQMLYLHCDNWVRSDNITKLCLLFKNWNQVNRKQECISVGCIPTAAVAATRCEYRGVGRPPAGRPPLRQNLLEADLPNRQTLLKHYLPLRR